MRFSTLLYGLALALSLASGAVIPLDKRGHDVAANRAEVYATNHVDVGKRGHDAANKAQELYDWPHIAVSKRSLPNNDRKRDHTSQANSFGTEVYQSNHVDVGKRESEPSSDFA
ncbi:hypothetical protein TWF281_000892 [Arthrobotrys megalospora]